MCAHPAMGKKRPGRLDKQGFEEPRAGVQVNDEHAVLINVIIFIKATRNLVDLLNR